MEYCAAIKCLFWRMYHSKGKSLCNDKWKKQNRKLYCAIIYFWGALTFYGMFQQVVPSKERKDKTKKQWKGVNQESMRSEKLGDGGMFKVPGTLYPLLHLVFAKSGWHYYNHLWWANFEQSLNRNLASWTISQGKGKIGFELKSTSWAQPMLSALPQAASLPW